jgi:hypothetical protein
MPGTVGIGPKGPLQARRFLPQGPLWRKHAQGPGTAQNDPKSARAARACFIRLYFSPIRFPISPDSPHRANHDRQFHHFAGVVPMLPGIEHDPDPQGRVSAKWVTVFLATDAKRLRGDHAQAKIAAIAPPANKTQYDPALQIQGSRMKDDRKSGEPTKNSRQDRLKLALRENLKRRKSQARGRSDPAAASSEDVDASLDDAGEGPGR